MTLLVHLIVLAVGGLRETRAVRLVSVVDLVCGGILRHSLDRRALSPVLRRSLPAGSRCIANGWQLRSAHLRRRSDRGAHLSVCARLLLPVFLGVTSLLLPLPLLISLARGLLFLFLGLPFLADLLEFFWRPLRAVRLHRNVSIQVIERSIRLFAAVPATLVHALDFFISPSRALVLLCAWDRNK